MRAEDLLQVTPEGLFCPPGGFYIDPMRPAALALVTHAHADHARPGHGAVMATPQTLELMAIRYGEGFTQQRRPAMGRMQLGPVTVSFHPAGHVLGSAQIRLEMPGAPVIVVSGDYCRRPNPVCAPYEPVPCDVFVTEATFGLPVFRHPDAAAEIAKLLESMAAFPERDHLIGAYALGKAQRVIMLLRQAGYDAPIGLHGAMMRLCDYHIAQGVALGDLLHVEGRKVGEGGQVPPLCIAPPSAFGSAWVHKFRDPVIGYASGWMGVRARARQRRVELPLTISDHVDWTELTATLTELAPQEVWITHGAEEGLMRWCALNGIAARPLRLIGYETEADAEVGG